MKRLTASLLVFMLLLSGCALFGNDIKEPATFYYPRNAVVYGTGDGVITTEIREASGHRGDMPYLLALYLQGPLDEGLRSPFPAGCTLVDVRASGKKLIVTLDASFAQLEDLDLSIAGVCFAKTCIGLAEVDTVQIISHTPDDEKKVNLILTAEDILLEDDHSLPQQTITEETQ